MKLKVLQTLTMLTKYVAYGTFAQILIMNLLLAGNSNAQKAVSAKEVDISIQLENNSVKNIFDAVEDLTDFSVSYDKNELGNKLKKSITVSKKNMKVSDLLLEISKQADLKFKQVNKVIHAKRISPNDDNEPKLEINLVPDVDITGKVTDENNQGLPGASVLVKGTSNGVTTDLDGNYKLSVPDDAMISWTNVPFLRAGETYMNVAEAKIRLNGAGAGDAEINAIRDRADLGPISGGDIAALMHESRTEEAGENMRYQNLLRWHKAGIINLTTFFTADKMYSTDVGRKVWNAPKNYYQPLPQLDIDNSDGVLIQNPAWVAGN